MLLLSWLMIMKEVVVYDKVGQRFITAMRLFRVWAGLAALVAMLAQNKNILEVSWQDARWLYLGGQNAWGA